MPHELNRLVFKNVFVTVTPDDAKIIEWQLDPSFRPASSTFLFFVEVARAAGEWTRLNPSSPVIDSCLYVDMTRYRWNLDNDIYYRVILDDGQEHASKPEATLGVINAHNYKIMRDVIRKEYLRLKKYVGSLGFLLKRRNGGTLCPVCLDHDTGDVIVSQCSQCFGTKYVKGYYNAYPFFIDMSGVSSSRDVNPPFAVTDNKNRTIRAVSYPRLDTYDIWVDGDKNKRYLAREVQTAVEMSGKALVYVAQFREIPPTDIAYKIPLEQPITAEELAAEPTLTDGGWRTGLARIDF